jgi:SNF2 family DNA or RNA helicase
MICNLGTAYERQVQGKIEKETSPARWSSSLTEKYFTEMLALGKVKCSQCSVDIDDRLGDIPGQVGMNGTLLYMSECLRLLCVECFNINSFSMGWCGHSPPCHVAPVSRQSTTKSSVTHLPPSVQGLPTKVLALMQQLQAAAPGSKRYGEKYSLASLLVRADLSSVVFSTWTSSLDIIELGLHSASISFVRVDGTSTHKSREKELQKFREDLNIQVLLMTLACGSVGCVSAKISQSSVY